MPSNGANARVLVCLCGCVQAMTIESAVSGRCRWSVGSLRGGDGAWGSDGMAGGRNVPIAARCLQAAASGSGRPSGTLAASKP